MTRKLLTRIILGICLLVAVLIGSVAWQGPMEVFDGTKETQMYLLSTIAQTVGTFFGITVSFALLASQLVGELYTPYAARLITHDRRLRLFTTLNVATIGFSLLLLADGEYFAYSSRVTAAAGVPIALGMAIASTLILPFYIVGSFGAITPTRIAEQLARGITLRSLLASAPAWIRGRQEDPALVMGSRKGKDVFTPFSDIVTAAIQRRHFENAQKVLEILVLQVCAVLETIGAPPQAVARAAGEGSGTDAPAPDRPRHLDDQEQAAVITAHLCLHVERMFSGVNAADFRHWLRPALTYLLYRVFEVSRHRGFTEAPMNLLALVRSLPKEYDLTYISYTLGLAGCQALAAGHRTVAVRTIHTLAKIGCADVAEDWLRQRVRRNHEERAQVEPFLHLLYRVRGILTHLPPSRRRHDHS